MKKIQLSIIIPFVNEQLNLVNLHHEIIDVLSTLSFDSEIIYVDDGSVDASNEVLEKSIKKIFSSHVKVKLVVLERNFGQTAAIMAGINIARGEWISFLDADLQNDPHDLLKMLDYLNSGYDAVYGWRRSRKDGIGRNISSQIANWLIRILFRIPLHDVGCSVKAYRKSFLKNLHFYGETHRIMSVITFLRRPKYVEIPVRHRVRLYGKSNYGYDRVLKLIIDLITLKFLHSYGTKPAYLFGSIGLTSNILGGVTLLLVGYRKFFQGAYVHRDPLFLIAIFFILIGTQFILMGLLAELIMRTYYETQRKLIFEIKFTKVLTTKNYSQRL